MREEIGRVGGIDISGGFGVTGRRATRDTLILVGLETEAAFEGGFNDDAMDPEAAELGRGCGGKPSSGNEGGGGAGKLGPRLEPGPVGIGRMGGAAEDAKDGGFGS